MKNNSMKYVKKFYKKHPEYHVATNDFSNLWATDSYVKSLVTNNFSMVWTDEGLKCQMKEKDTGQIKIISVKYNPDCSDFDHVEVVHCFDIMDFSGTTGYINAMTQIINNILWNNIDIRPGMPEHYDVDTEKEAYEEYLKNHPDAEPIESYFEGATDTYFDYDVNYTVGDFICFKDSKESYKLEWMASNKEVKEILEAHPEVNPIRYIVALPVKIEYKLREADNS